MTVEEWMKESADLDKMIESLGFKSKSDEMYVNGYTSPMAFNQRSELWKVKETEEKSHKSLETVQYTLVATIQVGDNSVNIRFFYHSLPVYKKHLYMKQLVEFLKNKKW